MRGKKTPPHFNEVRKSRIPEARISTRSRPAGSAWRRCRNARAPPRTEGRTRSPPYYVAFVRCRNRTAILSRARGGRQREDQRKGGEEQEEEARLPHQLGQEDEEAAAAAATAAAAAATCDKVTGKKERRKKTPQTVDSDLVADFLGKQGWEKEVSQFPDQEGDSGSREKKRANLPLKRPRGVFSSLREKNEAVLVGGRVEKKIEVVGTD